MICNFHYEAYAAVSAPKSCKVQNLMPGPAYSAAHLYQVAHPERPCACALSWRCHCPWLTAPSQGCPAQNIVSVVHAVLAPEWYNPASASCDYTVSEKCEEHCPQGVKRPCSSLSAEHCADISISSVPSKGRSYQTDSSSPGHRLAS